MKIAITGIRGIPACYGGFETFAEELGTRLVKRGHEVVVYGRSHVINYQENVYQGVKIKLLPAPRHKYFETPVHSFLCLVDLFIRKPVDVVLVCNAANSPFVWIPRLRGTPVVVNVDGIERKRAKWNILGKCWYFFGELSSVLFANQLISDANVIREYYLQTWRCDSTVIRYGYHDGGARRVEYEDYITDKISGLWRRPIPSTSAIFQETGLEPGKYLLYVSRLEPENNAHRVIEAYQQLTDQGMPLVIVGDAPYAKEYIAHLKRIAGKNVVFLGFRFGEDYRALQLGSYLYIQATEVGGTHPALVEAMGFGNCIIANGTPENLETLADAGAFYEKNNVAALSQCMRELLDNPLRAQEFRAQAWKRAKDIVSWDKIVRQYEELFEAHLVDL